MDPTTTEASDVMRAVLERLPPRLQRLVEWSLSRWPGRIATGTMRSAVRIELFDRSMTIAAQAFSSLIPIIIALASWAGRASHDIVESTGVPPETAEMIDDALDGGQETAFGILGVLIVLVSATSLSRALTRAHAAIWLQPRPRARLVSAWRWAVVVLGIALSLILVRQLSRFAAGLPPPDIWQLVVWVTCDAAIAIFVPLLLLGGAIPARQLVPGALLFASVMLLVRPASSAWLPRALEASSGHYGSIGVAFTYLAYLYVVAFCYLAAGILGAVIARDRGRLGEFIRGSA